MATELICGICGKTIDRIEAGRTKVTGACQDCNRALTEELEPKGFAARRTSGPQFVLMRYQGFDAFKKKRA